MSGNVAVDIHSDGQTGNVGGAFFNVHAQSGGLAAEALGSDTQ